MLTKLFGVAAAVVLATANCSGAPAPTPAPADTPVITQHPSGGFGCPGCEPQPQPRERQCNRDDDGYYGNLERGVC